MYRWHIISFKIKKKQINLNFDKIGNPFAKYFRLSLKFRIEFKILPIGDTLSHLKQNKKPGKLKFR